MIVLFGIGNTKVHRCCFNERGICKSDAAAAKVVGEVEPQYIAAGTKVRTRQQWCRTTAVAAGGDAGKKLRAARSVFEQCFEQFNAYAGRRQAATDIQYVSGQLAHTRKPLYTFELHLDGEGFAHRRCSHATYNGDMEAFIRGLPKAELHLHLEGTLEPELALRLARKHGIQLPHSSVEQLRRSYQFTDLQSFLDIYLAASSVLRDEDDFHALTTAYLRRAQQQGITHVEVFFDPQSHTARDIALVTVLNGIHRALLQGERELGITHRLILCFLRHLSADDAMRTLEQALPHKSTLAAVGLDSSEKGHPPAKFAEVFARARAEGLLAVAHAGEEGPADYVRDALDLLKVQRIDHGVRCEEDPQLVQRLARERIPLTMCPLSNVRLKVFERMQDHNLRRLLRHGLCVTVNSDDPAYFGGYLNENYLALHRGLGVTADELVQLARNSFEASFLSKADQTHWQSMIDEYVRRTPVH